MAPAGPARPWDPGPELRAVLSFQPAGRFDPTCRFGEDEEGRPTFAKAWRTPDGPATLRITEISPGAFQAEAWGPGADRALAAAPACCGADDVPTALVPLHPQVHAALKAHRGLRLARVPWTVDRLMITILEQRVKWEDAVRAWRMLVEDHGEPAPGPCALRVAPEPARIRRLPFDTWWRYGVDRRRAATLCEVAFQAAKIAVFTDAAQARAVLRHLRGIGPWTDGVFCGFGLGDPDAVVLGDLHMPNHFSKIMTGVPWGTDEQMLAGLAPYAGQRFRVQVLLLRSPPPVVAAR